MDYTHHPSYYNGHQTEACKSVDNKSYPLVLREIVTVREL